MNADVATDTLRELETYLLQREVRKGFFCLDKFFAADVPINPSLDNGIAFLFVLAQWIDMGYHSPVSLGPLLDAFLTLDQTRLPLADFLRMRLVQAFCCLWDHHYGRATFLLTTTLSMGEDLMSPYETFVAHLWMGRSQRLEGDLVHSLLHIRRARDIATELNAPRLVAVSKIHESWLIFHNGQRAEPLKLLDEAEHELLSTGHALSLANISSARGRFLRSAGRYSDALEHFERAIKICLPYHAAHPNLARAYVNAAYVKRLMALTVLPKVPGAPAKAKIHELAQKITSEALALLTKAAAIYKKQDHRLGEGSILVDTGYLHLETGDIDRALREASRAYRLGEEHQNNLLMARASILLASVELAFCEEQVDGQLEGRTHAVSAAAHSDLAINLLAPTQNRRLQAAAYIVRGLIATDESSLDLDLAREYASRAGKLLGEEERDHLSRKLSSLNQKILRSTTVDEMVRAWCMGDLGGKSFQEVQERFADIVIPRVWNRLERKVSRVAQELSISPKKVRRILRNSKHLWEGERADSSVPPHTPKH